MSPFHIVVNTYARIITARFIYDNCGNVIFGYTYSFGYFYDFDMLLYNFKHLCKSDSKQWLNLKVSHFASNLPKEVPNNLLEHYSPEVKN